MVTKSNYPEYLQAVLLPITAQSLPYFEANEQWYNTLTWKGQVVINGNEYFTLTHSGILDTDGAIYTEDNEPLVIIANSLENSHSIVLFDERIHGINPILNPNIKYTSPVLKTYSQIPTNTTYKLYIYASTNTDFEDEYPVVDNQLIQIDNTLYSQDYLQCHAFDFIGIIAVNHNQTIKLIKAELL